MQGFPFVSVQIASARGVSHEKICEVLKKDCVKNRLMGRKISLI